MRRQYLPVGEDEAPVDQEQGEVVPGRGVGLGHVEQQPVAVVRSDGKWEESIRSRDHY